MSSNTCLEERTRPKTWKGLMVIFHDRTDTEHTTSSTELFVGFSRLPSVTGAFRRVFPLQMYLPSSLRFLVEGLECTLVQVYRVLYRL